MPFEPMEKPTYPRRLWSVTGFPGAGKSTFAAQLAAPLLVIDADGRFTETLDVAEGPVYALGGTPADNTDPERIRELLAENMPGSGIKTVVLDSLTAIVSPIVTRALTDRASGATKNLAASWQKKALCVRTLQDALTRWGCDVLWVWHEVEYRDAKAKAGKRATLPRTERARLMRSLNVGIEILKDAGGRRGVRVLWARRGRVPEGVLWDDTGCFRGMPQRIERAVYAGLTPEQQAAIEAEAPEIFPDPAAAIAWGLEQGAFNALQHSRAAYDKLKAERGPQNAQEMARLWVDDVRRRLAEAAE